MPHEMFWNTSHIEHSKEKPPNNLVDLLFVAWFMHKLLH